MFGVTIALQSQVCDCEQLTREDVWDTIVLPSQACGCELLTGKDAWGHELRYHRTLVAV